jgi:hypothetical protein
LAHPAAVSAAEQDDYSNVRIFVRLGFTVEHLITYVTAITYGFREKLVREVIFLLWNAIASRKNDWHCMNKKLLSQLLDGAAFPAIMLAIAVGQMRVAPDQGTTSSQGKRGGTALNAPTGVQQQAKGVQQQWIF